MIKFLVLVCIVSAAAWTPTQRCIQHQRPRRDADVPEPVEVVSNIDTIVEKQKQTLKEEYENYKFYGSTITELTVNADGTIVTMHAPHNCTFYTYKPRVLPGTTYNCNTPNCKLTRTVSSQQTYTATDGYNWGAKISAKLSLKKVFEVGGEASIGGTFTCAYSNTQTTSVTLECPAPAPGRLQLFVVNSDLNCQFGTVTLSADKRGDHYSAIINNLSNDDIEEIVFKFVAKTYNDPDDLWVMVDSDKISSDLYARLIRVVPEFNPYTDLFLINKIDAETYTVELYYFTPTSETSESSAIIPFTNEHGDAVYEYICQFTPLQ